MANADQARIARKQRLWELARSYRRRFLFDQTTCTYCGLASDTWDHVPAVAIAYDLTREWLETNGFGMWLVPACRTCNARLNARKLLTVESRAKHIWKRLHDDLEQLSSAEWTVEELMELGPRLGAYVRSGADQVLVLQRRIAWAEGVAKMTATDE